MVANVKVTLQIRNIKPVSQYLKKMSPEEFSNVVADMAEEIYASALVSIAAKVKKGMPEIPNVGKYAAAKSAGFVYKQSYGHMTEVVDQASRYHSLGEVTGMLRQGILNTPMGNLQKGSGRNAALAEAANYFSTPMYIWYVHEGKARVQARPFITQTVREIEDGVARQMEAMLEQIDIFAPGTFRIQWNLRRGVPGGAEEMLPSG